MESFEKVKLVDDNWEEEHEKFVSFEEHIKSLDKEKRTHEMVEAVKNIKNSDNRNLATYLLGQRDGDMIQEDRYRLIGYIVNHEKQDEQIDIMSYLDQMLDHEEDVSMEPRDPNIDSTLYAYSVGLDISKEVSDLSEKYDDRYDDKTITDKATISVLAKCILDNTLYYPITDDYGLDWYAKEYFPDCYADYLESIKSGKEMIAKTSKNGEQK